jgi:hypothetical protein
MRCRISIWANPERRAADRVELSGANSGFILLPYGEVLAAHQGSEPEPDLIAWADQRLTAAYTADETAAVDTHAFCRETRDHRARYDERRRQTEEP